MYMFYNLSADGLCSQDKKELLFRINSKLYIDKQICVTENFDLGCKRSILQSWHPDLCLTSRH